VYRSIGADPIFSAAQTYIGMTKTFDDRAVPTAQSPCVRNCCLDENDVCLGCGRLLEEILRWRSASEAEREAMLLLASNRRMQRRRESRRSP
jgi:predicted Fe-S protein YdhL (DUF1289 family)